ncbi:4'-phosphopantetheinyl transferase superfamily protein [Vibrio alginolyticus]|uniref:Enterobactin synthase component D n=2 Tax=Vibrio alginolyticus TaxID=663 RepID=A0A7Y4F178_VIBAL|nr:4'-phosphopantetheinyl transferase superfamily protein [Vibrio alginolyticus]
MNMALFLSSIAPPFQNKLPPSVLVHAVSYSVEEYHDSLYDYFSIFKPSNISASVIKRRAEFLAGRCCAKAGLSKLGYGRAVLLAGKHREPLWPNGVVGSISHTSDIALAVLARKTDIRLLGVDIESLVIPLADELCEIVVNDREWELLRNCCPDEVALVIGFSAKEAYFKALFPKVQRYFDFLDVVICKVSNNKTGWSLSISSKDLTLEPLNVYVSKEGEYIASLAYS